MLMSTQSGGGESYTGPLDEVTGLWGIDTARALKASMIGEDGYSVQKLDGGAQPTQEFTYNNTETGLIDSAGIVTFLGADEGLPVVFHDHVGSVDLEGGSLSGAWEPSAQNSKPGMVPTASYVTSSVSVGPLAIPSGGCTVFLVGSPGMTLQIDNGNSLQVDINTTGPFIYMADDSGNETGGEIDPGDVTAGVHLYTLILVNGSKAFKIDGVSKTFTADYDAGGVIGAVEEIVEFGVDTGTTFLTAIICPPLSAQDEQTLASNLQAYWNTPALP